MINSQMSVHSGIKPESDMNCNENIGEPTQDNKEDASNENTCKTPMVYTSGSSFIQESTEFQWCMDDACTKEYHAEYDSHPASIFSFDETQSSYDDISKNIDANLAEIDMETFCSEDIHSLLSIPAMYGESISSLTDNTQNTTESCTSTGKMETASHSLSDGYSETSLYKNKPLFSPVREPEARLAAISTDSLDFSSLEKQDINRSYQAQKNNYMIAFEASATHLSDESNGFVNKAASVGSVNRGAMIQSDVGFTTWSKIQKLKRSSLCAVQQTVNNKSFSLPSLSAKEVVAADGLKYGHSPGSVLLYSVQGCHPIKAHDYSLSLLKLYMQKNLCSTDSGSELALHNTPENRALDDFSCSRDDEMSGRGERIKKVQEGFDTNSNENFHNSFYDRNSQQVIEHDSECSENNNLVASVQPNDNDSSLYFEDSLMEITAQKTKFAYVSPIKEEELFECSGDEASLGNKNTFLDESSNVICHAENDKSSHYQAHTLTNSVAVSTSENSNCNKTLGSDSVTQTLPNIVKEIASQYTQTKCTNQLVCMEETKAAKVSRISQDGSHLFPVNGGYKVNLHDSTSGRNQLQPSNRLLMHALQQNLDITRMCNNSTQIPVHVTDKAVQTLCIGSVPWKPLEYENDARSFYSNEVIRKEKKLSESGRPLYIYYPNFSLPDLSFLNKPLCGRDGTSHCHGKSGAVRDRDSFSKRRAKSSEGRDRSRLHICDKIYPVNHVEDWASLSVLLPENVKGIIRKNAMNKKNNCCIPTCLELENFSLDRGHHPHCCWSVELNGLEEVEFSGMKRSDTYCKQKENNLPANSHSKRWSLQEPLLKYSTNLTISGHQRNQGVPHRIQLDKCHGSSEQPCSKSFACRVPRNSRELHVMHNKSHLCQNSSQHNLKNSHEDTVFKPVVEMETHRDLKLSLCSRSESPPHEFFISPIPSSNVEEKSGVTIERVTWTELVQTKYNLFQCLEDSVNRILSSFTKLVAPDDQDDMLADVLVFEKALFRLLSDGVLSTPQEDCIFACIWKIIEKSVSGGTINHSFASLVRDVCDQDFPESSLKFCSFVTGLLNMGWLEVWFMHFLTCTDILRAWYHPTSLLYLLTFHLAVDLRNELSSLLKSFLDVKFNLNLNAVIELASKHDGKMPVCGKSKSCRCKFDEVSSLNQREIKLPTLPDNATEGAHDHATPNRKTKTLKDGCSDKAVPTESTADSGCSSGNFQSANKEEFPRFQQLRQQWEKLALLEDSASESRLSSVKTTSVKSVETTLPKKVTCISSLKSAVNKPSDISLGKTGEAVRRRSMIPVHKSIKTTTKRSGSAPSEKSHR